MKLGYLISQYPAVNHTYILREVLSLRAQGVEVHVVSVRRCDRAPELLSSVEAAEQSLTFSILGAGPACIASAHVRVLLRHPLRYLRGMAFALGLSRGTPRLLAPYFAYFAEAVVAGAYFARSGISNIHTHYASTVLLILARIFPIRYSMTVHGSGEFVDVVGFHMARKVAGAHFVLTISLYGMSQVMNASDSRHWHKILMIPLGVAAEGFVPQPPRAARDPGAPFRILSVGHLSPMKGYPVLIEAVHLLRLRGRNVALTIVGEGPVRASLEEQIRRRHLESHVQLPGACNHERVMDHYRAADAFALSSFLEGVPVVLMEAMAMELSCIATGITGIPELIENGVEGLLVPPASAEHIADAVQRLIDDPALARRLGQAARSKILAKYDLQQNTAQLHEALRRYWQAPGELLAVAEAS